MQKRRKNNVNPADTCTVRPEKTRSISPELYSGSLVLHELKRDKKEDGGKAEENKRGSGVFSGFYPLWLLPSLLRSLSSGSVPLGRWLDGQLLLKVIVSGSRSVKGCYWGLRSPWGWYPRREREERGRQRKVSRDTSLAAQPQKGIWRKNTPLVAACLPGFCLGEL